MLDIHVRTSYGTLNGMISFPDTITSLTSSEYDTLQLGESLTISCSGSDADFYNIMLGYMWQEDNGIREYSWIDTFAVGNSITFPGSIFTHNGRIYYIYALPMNGPLPEAGSIGNMVGFGNGFLYYYGESISQELWIIVGSGLFGLSATMTADKLTEKDIKTATRRKIENLLIGHQ
jgi:hypothetical protein